MKVSWQWCMYVHVNWLRFFPDQFETLMHLGHKQDHFSNTIWCPSNIMPSLVHVMCPSTIRSMANHGIDGARSSW